MTSKPKPRNLAYWKGRKVQLREAIVDLSNACLFADLKIKEQERRLLKK